MHEGGVPIQRCTGRWVAIYSPAGNPILRFTENDAFKESNIRVIGISPDSVEKQDAFAKKQNLTVSLVNARFPALGSPGNFHSTQF